MDAVESRGYTFVELLPHSGEGEVRLYEKDAKRYVVKSVCRLSGDQYGILGKINAMRSEYFPETVEILDDGDKTHIVREYIEGATLRDEILKNKLFSYGRAKEIILEICRALKALHGARPSPIIYRDLKPQNVIITPQGNVKLIDFGISRYFKAESARDTILAGTRGYTAPEAMAGMQSDERSDVYSAGLVFYEMLTGKSLLDPPYQVRPLVEHNKYLPTWLDGVIAKATSLNRIDRYACIDEFVAALENGSSARAAGLRGRRGKAMFAVLAAALAVAACIALYAFAPKDGPADTLLELGFDRPEDAAWIIGYDDPNRRFEIADGYLNLLKGGCNLNCELRNGMLIHYRLKSHYNACAVSLGPYRINASLDFECVYYDETAGTDISTGNRKLYGMPIVNTGQTLDVILYTTKGNEAVYAFVCDGQAGSVAYTAYRIPGTFDGQLLPPVMYAFFEKESDYLKIDSIRVAEGPLKRYLKEHVSVYPANKKRIDAFLAQDVEGLPEMELHPVQ